MRLDIWFRNMITGAQKPSREACCHGHGFRPERCVFERDLGLVCQTADLVAECRPLAFLNEPSLQMVLKVLANTGQGTLNRDALFFQLIAFADAGIHQHLLRANCTR